MMTAHTQTRYARKAFSYTPKILFSVYLMAPPVTQDCVWSNELDTRREAVELNLPSKVETDWAVRCEGGGQACERWSGRGVGAAAGAD
jgi:hypothetical protein